MASTAAGLSTAARRRRVYVSVGSVDRIDRRALPTTPTARVLDVVYGEDLLTTDFDSVLMVTPVELAVAQPSGRLIE